MKKLIPAMLAALGIGAATTHAAQVQQVDPKTIRYSMPTVAADSIEFVMPTKESFEGAPQFHEDEWCQLEFYPSARLSEVKRLLVEYKAFELKHRVEHGWTDIYARRIQRSTFVASSSAVDRVAKSIGAANAPAPILITTSSPLGQVKSGFSLRLPGSVLLYGLANEQGINTLAAMVERGGDDLQLTKAFASLNKQTGLVLVDWRSQMVLVSSDPDGGISVWRP